MARPQTDRRSPTTARILLGVTGGIAAYKSLELVRLCRRTGWEVTVVMTRHARRLVGPESFASLSGKPVALDLFPRRRPARQPARIEHVDLAARADLVVVAPATANILGKLAAGVADDLLSTLLLAVPDRTLAAGRVLLAPAMNVNMWQSPSVRRNLGWLADQGYRFVGPETGELACGDRGSGRLAAPESIFVACRAALEGQRPPVLTGRRVLVTAGRTEEPLDPVRVLTNRSSGRLGVELARAFAAAGAEVQLIAGPLVVPPPSGIPVQRVTTSTELHSAVLEHLPATDVLVMSAAVADYRPTRPSREKRHAPRLNLALTKTTDILKAVSKAAHHAVVIGFSHDPSVVNARTKLRDKRLDLIVANPYTTAGAETIQATLVRRGRTERLPEQPKSSFARRLVAETAALLALRKDLNG